MAIVVNSAWEGDLEADTFSLPSTGGGPLCGVGTLPVSTTTVTISTTAVTNVSLIFVASSSAGYNAPLHEITANRVAGTSFDIASGSPAVARTFIWFIVEPY